ncbi:MAG: putative porin [Gammaproteobacteria bacterium]|nr:putative porin [Gammaproteobacteria bacterium]
MKKSIILLGAYLLSSQQAVAEYALTDSVSFSGDIRGGYYTLHRDDRNGNQDVTDEARLRIRLGLKAKLNNQWQAKVRFAGRYSTVESNSNHFEIFSRIPGSDGLRHGDSTLDEFYVRYQPSAQWDLKIGRFQTKFELAGVAKKSLDRNNSPNVDITWTDGIHAIYKMQNGWKGHVIIQRNLSAGATEVRRAPLDFSDDGSHVSYFFALENNEKYHGSIIQRGIDLTYLPKALQTDGNSAGRIDDYLALVGRMSAQWPMSGSMKLMLGSELGYAFDTPTKVAVSTGTSGDTGGFAGNVKVSFIDIVPNHSLGIVYGVVQEGWLLSPDFRNNNRLIETRYLWKMDKKQTLEARLRHREDLHQLTGSQEKREDVDLYLRYTYKF